MSDVDSQGLPEPLQPAVTDDAVAQFAEYLVNRLASVELSLDSARSIIGDGPASERVAAATAEVEALIRDIRSTMLGFLPDRPGPAFGRLAHPAPVFQPGPRDAAATLQRYGSRAGALQMRLVHTARAMQLRALDTAALLEQYATRAKAPGRLDYPTEIKRWQSFADHAEQIARRWEPPA